MRTERHAIGASIVAIAGLAAMLVAPASAGASPIHTGRLVFPDPRNLPSIGPTPPPPADQQNETAHEVLVTYNAAAGTVTFREEVWDPAYWGERVSARFALGNKCSSNSLGYPRPFSAEVEAGPYSRFGTHQVAGAASLTDYVGEVKSVGTYDGRYFEVAFTSYAFRNRIWHCGSFQFSTTTLGKYISGGEHFTLSGWSKPRHKRKRR